MTARKKPEPQHEGPGFSFVVGPKTIMWVLGALGALFTVIISWNAIWERIDVHWRLESLQAAKDKEVDAKLKSVATKAEIGRAWLFWSMSDLKAESRERWLATCIFMKWPSAECDKARVEASRARADEAEAKRTAVQTGKE